MISLSSSRIKELAASISQIPVEFFYRIDTIEPEYRTFDSLNNKYAKTSGGKLDSTLALLGIGTGLIDYQQKNPAKSVWQPLERIVDHCGFPSELDDVKEIHLRLASSSRFGSAKSARVKRMYTSGFASWFWQDDLTGIRKDPYEAWRTLAWNMSDPVDKKTIVMAMKAFDMETLAITKHYLQFPADIPIMVDSRVTYVSLSSGIVAVEPFTSVDDIASRYRSQIIRAWLEVINIVRSVIGQEFNALRLDSLVWQAGEYKNPAAIASYLREMHLSEEIASLVACQLIWKK